MKFEKRKLGTVATYINGRAFKPSEWEKEGSPIIRIQNLTDNNAACNYSTKVFDEKFRVRHGDLLFAWSASLGAHIWKKEDAWLNQHIFRVVPNDDIDKMYLYYFLCCVVGDLYAKTHGSGMVHITKGPFMNTEILVPSLADQKRIVSRIEELFSELDQGINTLQTIKQQLTVYRQAVLKKAFVGDLTKDWRKVYFTDTADQFLSTIETKHKTIGMCPPIEDIELPAIPKSWTWVSIGSISSGAEYGSSQKSLKSGVVPVLRMGNIQNGTFDFTDLVYSNDDEEICKYELHYGDVLFNRTNSPELVGKTAAYKSYDKAIFAGYLIRINQVDEVDCDYLTYYLNSCVAKSYGNKVKTDAVNQSNINSKKLYSYPFPLCSRDEQGQIVKELESRLSICDSIEHTVDDTLEQADAMRQSILKKAFEGGLT